MDRSFVQSARLPHQVDANWTDALFRLLESNPRDSLYSCAFFLSFMRTLVPNNDDGEEMRSHDSTMVNEKNAAFVASRELFDLVDDHVREIDTLTATELRRSRCFDLADFQRANRAYLSKFRILDSVIGKYRGALDQTKIAGENNNHEFKLTDEELDEIRRVFVRIDRSTLLPLPFTLDGSECTTAIDDVHPYDREILVADSLLMAAETDERSENGTISAIFSKPFNAIETFARYAPVLYRYESLDEIARSIRKSRENVRIFPIYLPVNSVWQGGTSQLLWVTLHSLAALSVARSNRHLRRLLVLLKNLSFYIWCGQCEWHWFQTGGDSYFARLSEIRFEAHHSKIPIDIILARCHNIVTLNGAGRGRALGSWTLAQIILDYRDFVERKILRRTNEPVDRWLSRFNTANNESLHGMLEKMFEPMFLNVGKTPQSNLFGTWQDESDNMTRTLLWSRCAMGEILLLHLWRLVDPRGIVPQGAM